MRTKEENICLIQALSNANGVSGFEDEVAELGQKETEAYCNVTIDSLRNTYMSLKNNRKQSCKVWIDAHSDEVGYIVQAIKPNGTMNFLTIGGSDISSLPSNKVRVQTCLLYTSQSYLSMLLPTALQFFFSYGIPFFPLFFDCP